MKQVSAMLISCAVVLLAPACNARSTGGALPEVIAGMDVAAATPDVSVDIEAAEHVADTTGGAADSLGPESDGDLDNGTGQDVAATPDLYSGFFGETMLCTLTAGVYRCPIEDLSRCRPGSDGVFRCEIVSDTCGSCKDWPDPAPWYESVCGLVQSNVSGCMWAHTMLCRPCLTDYECLLGSWDGGEAHCIDYASEGHFCATFCDHVACPDGYACVPTTGSAGKTQAACRRIDGKCPCPQLPFIGGATECHPVGLPDCTVTRTCVDGVLTPCDAAKCGK